MSYHTSFKPTIPDSVVNYCMRKSGFECDDERACVLDWLIACRALRLKHTHRRTTHRPPLHNLVQLRTSAHARARRYFRIGSLTTARVMRYAAFSASSRRAWLVAVAAQRFALEVAYSAKACHDLKAGGKTKVRASSCGCGWLRLCMCLYTCFCYVQWTSYMAESFHAKELGAATLMPM